MKCLTPMLIDNPLPFSQKDRVLSIPCGKCVHCMKSRSSSWAFRIDQESKLHPRRYFVTLTYANDYLIKTNNGFATLFKRDVQLFMKRLRKRLRFPLKYYLVGEYGGQYGRPHYHAIILGTDISPQLIQDCWLYGYIHFGSVQRGSIYYTLKYFDKGQVVGKFAADDRVKEFALMSKGLGKCFYELNASYLAKRPHAQYTYYDQQKIPIPRYFRKLLYRDFPGLKQLFIKLSRSNTDETDQFQTEQEFRAIVGYNDSHRMRESTLRNSI